MHPAYFGYVALEIARDRLREAARQRLVDEARGGSRHDRPAVAGGAIRHSLARGAAAVSRGAAAVSRGAAGIARRLDERTADEAVDGFPRPSAAA